MLFLVTPAGSGVPDTPTIGTATAGNAQATVPFTVPSYTGKGGAVTYRALSTPSSVEATGSGTPITVSGLTNGVSYTFQVRLETSYGVNSTYSAASNSVTPAAPPPPPPPPPPPCGFCNCSNSGTKCPNTTGNCFVVNCICSISGASCAPSYCSGPNCPL